MNKFEKSKIICLDVETTGLVPGDDEILQLSIINGNFYELFNKYIKPSRKKKWDNAQKIHHITPEKVKNKKTMKVYKKQIESILNYAELIVGYNLEFDINMLIGKGIEIPKNLKYFDVMEKFAPIYGEWNEYYQSYKWQKLTTCAKFFDYEFKAHDSLEDTKATLYCYFEILKIIENTKENKV